MSDYLSRFLCNGTAAARAARTLFQGLLGTAVALIPYVYKILNETLATIGLPEVAQPIVVAVVMTFLAPIMARIGQKYAEKQANKYEAMYPEFEQEMCCMGIGQCGDEDIEGAD